MLNVALPKGRLGEKVYAMFEKAGFPCPSIHENNRKLIFERFSHFSVFMLSPPQKVMGFSTSKHSFPSSYHRWVM